MRQRTPKPESKPDSSVKVAIISTIGVIVVTLITALLAPVILRALDKTPTPFPTNLVTTIPVNSSASSSEAITPLASFEPTKPDTPYPTSTIASLPFPTNTLPSSFSFVHELPIYKAESSSEAACPSPCSAFKVFDGRTDYGGGWGSVEGDGIGAWVRLFMPETFTLSQIRIFLVIPTKNVLDQPKDVTLAFDDGSTYDAHLSFKDGWQTIDFPSVNTSTVQITINDVYPSETYHNNQVEIKEVQVFGVEAQAYITSTSTASVSQVTKLAIYKAESSSEAACPSTCSASKVYDEMTGYGGGWFSIEGDGVGAWIRVFIPEPRLLAQLRIFMVVPTQNVGDQVRDITLTFDDGSAFNTRIPFSDGWQTVNFPSVTATAVQITINSVYPSQTYRNNQVEIKEVQLFGTN